MFARAVHIGMHRHHDDNRIEIVEGANLVFARAEHNDNPRQIIKGANLVFARAEHNDARRIINVGRAPR